VVRRLRIRVIDLDALDPRITAREPLGDLVEDDDRRAVARPDDQHAAHGVRQVEMPRERPWIGEPRQVGEVHSGARDDGGEPVTVHVLVQTGDVGDDLALRLRHGFPFCERMRQAAIIAAARSY
jgi:hypothetical protein